MLIILEILVLRIHIALIMGMMRILMAILSRLMTLIIVPISIMISVLLILPGWLIHFEKNMLNLATIKILIKTKSE